MAVEVPALGGPVGSAVTRRVGRRKQKSRSSLVELRPRDLVCRSRSYVCQVARDLRPHPPHGGAASAYTCSRRLGCESRSGHGRRAIVDASTDVDRNATSSGRRRARLAAMTAIPATFRAYVAEKVDGRWRRVERGVREFARGGPAARRGRDPGRLVERQLQGRPGDAGGRQGRPDQPAHPGHRPGRRGRRQRGPRRSPVGDGGPRPRLRAGRRRATAATPSTSACRPAGSCRWRPA